MRYPLVALSLAVLASHAFAEDEFTAKSLFFAQDNAVVAVGTGASPTAFAAASAPVTDGVQQTAGAGKVEKVSQKKKVARIGASYFIRLKENDGTTQDVLARRVFKSGEHFQLGVKVNRPSYVYILNEAPDGTVTQIYPQASQDNFVDAMGVVFFPAKGSFVFDSNPGMEKLMVYLTPEREHGDVTRRLRHAAPDLVSTPRTQTASDAGSCAAAPVAATAAADTGASGAAALSLADAGTGYAAKGIAFAPDANTGCGAKVAANDTQEFAAKGIVFSDDASPVAGGQVASYVVKQATKPEAANLYLKINLAHE
ncbi:DUF4384 domain-containing protein [Paraburkholderia sp. CNPSo 3272]|uniref:DUF4384 domain-containing protein n=1 Tax=Paraburkholderia sp. CNPSo 3272 TaxID=2940931 RepID=UPI0020B6D0F9|nr:DUF4384 domain-containing protein [Paraburkholderia sp. CNPSo 3272]MCP3727478.1 DUF4384 domain-containing protein [Paraburkholderia sp. CNPSo 3272]